MRLSHRKKVASKHGLYWPSRTKQARERREARAKLAAKAVQVAGQVSAIVAYANQLAQAFHSAARGIAEGIKGVKTWMLKSDVSQRKVKLPCDRHTGKILIKTPQNDKILN